MADLSFLKLLICKYYPLEILNIFLLYQRLMSKKTYFPALFLILLLAGCSSTNEKQKRLPIKLQLLGQVEIPYNYSFQDTPIGGLSGLTYDSQSKIFYVISDDRSDLAPARFYSFKLKLNEQGKFEKSSIQWQAVHILKSKDGKKYAKGTIDPEGIAAGPDSLIYISSEGDPHKNIAPFINAFSKNGTFVKALPIPNAFWSANPQKRKQAGIRENLAFEGLTITPDGNRLYAATENALLQDGPRADSTHGSPSRMLEYNLPSGHLVHQYEYNLAPVHFSKAAPGKFSVNGLSDILAIDNGSHLLSLDRNFVVGQGNRIGLYSVSTKGATDIRNIESLQKHEVSVQSVTKTLIAHLRDYGITIDNFEGLALSSRFQGGGRLLLMVSDNNFSSSQKTLFTVFSLHR